MPKTQSTRDASPARKRDNSLVRPGSDWVILEPPSPPAGQVSPPPREKLCTHREAKLADLLTETERARLEAKFSLSTRPGAFSALVDLPAHSITKQLANEFNMAEFKIPPAELWKVSLWMLDAAMLRDVDPLCEHCGRSGPQPCVHGATT